MARARVERLQLCRVPVVVLVEGDRLRLRHDPIRVEVERLVACHVRVVVHVYGVQSERAGPLRLPAAVAHRLGRRQEGSPAPDRGWIVAAKRVIPLSLLRVLGCRQTRRSHYGPRERGGEQSSTDDRRHQQPRRLAHPRTRVALLRHDHASLWVSVASTLVAWKKNAAHCRTLRGGGVPSPHPSLGLYVNKKNVACNKVLLDATPSCSEMSLAYVREDRHQQQQSEA